MQVSAVSFTVCFDRDEMTTEKVLSRLEEQYLLRYNADLQLITVRNYDEDTIHRLTGNRIILLKQLSRTTAQLVIK